MFRTLTISHVEFRFPGSEKVGPSRNGRMERNFRLFRFSGSFGQPREVLPKFRNEIPENVCFIRSQPGISRIFGRMENVPRIAGAGAAKDLRVTYMIG